jgi:hypothetical protein
MTQTGPVATVPAADGDTPQDLLPASGQVARARATYTSVYLVEVPDTSGLRPLDGPIDLTEPLELYDRPAEGVIVTTEQDWVPRAIGLGRLLHSLTLAPGESTRVALVDWARQVTARTSQTTSQTEAVTEEAARQRGITELTDAIAREEQSGSTVARSETTSSSHGASGGISGFLWGAGASASTATNRGLATNVSRTSGYRGLTTSTAQHIQDRTQQLATSSRDLHATAVVETSEAESTAVSTRVVTNYNHMHALTIEYWEVIQEYEVRTWTDRCDRCLFIPMQVLRFDASVFKRYKPVLVAVAPGAWARALESIDPFETSVYRTRSSSGESPVADPAAQAPRMVPMGEKRPRLIHLDWTPGPIEVTEPDPELLQRPEAGGGQPPSVTTGRRFTCFGIADDPTWPAGAIGWDASSRTWVPLGRCELRAGPPARSREGTVIDQKGEHRWRITGEGARLSLVHRGPRSSTWGTTNLTGVSMEFRDPDTGRMHRVGSDGLPEMEHVVERLPAADLPPRGGAERLTVWWDEHAIRAVGLAMRDDPDQTLGTPTSAATDYDVNQITFEPDERVTRIVFTSGVTPAGPVLSRVAITTDSRGPIELGPVLPPNARTVEERIEVGSGVLCGLFGTIDPADDRVLSLGFQVRGPHVRQDVIDHLNDNDLHYSQAIWASADDLTLTRILANYTYDGPGSGSDRRKTVSGTPLGARLDPSPVAITGNYLGFRWHFPDEDQRQAWLRDNELVESDRDDVAATASRVSLATDGVFAEAVLGRSNGAEKLDITRFWDWQSSPIPILPSEIAPVDTGSRARDVAAETGQLAAPTAVTHAMASLPDPTGTAAVLQAIATGNLFRDVSGLEATSSLLQKGLELAAQSEGKSAEQATKAMQQANDHMEKMSRIAVDAVKEVAPLMLGPAGAAVGGASKLGALLNFASQASAAPAAAGDGSAGEAPAPQEGRRR